MCLKDDNLKGQRVCIVAGPNIALAITLIKRLKDLFMNPEAESEHQLTFDTKETVLSFGRDARAHECDNSVSGLIVVSTPNKPGDMLQMLSEQPEEKCIYRRIYLPYTVGMGNIFSQKDIEIVKRSTSFEREYNLKFLGLVGNVFLPFHQDALYPKSYNDISIH